MLTDYHSHVLPAVDDGARRTKESLRMLDMWAAQGISRVVATPHFYPYKEPVERFWIRRDKALARMPRVSGHPRIVSGAEVYIVKGLLRKAGDFRRLAIAGSDYIMLELPYSGFKPWILDEVQNVLNYGFTPIFAHIERYLNWYKKADIARILSFEDAVWQINHESLLNRDTLNFTLELIRGGLPVIFGSDAHNTRERVPNAAAAYKLLRRELDKKQYDRLIELNASLI